MADEPAPTGAQVVISSTGTESGAGASKVPLHELLTERGKRQTAETELATVKPLVETYKQRAETAEASAAAAQERLSAIDAREKAEREALIESLPEADRPIAQAIQDPGALTAFAARVTTPAQPSVPVRTGTPGGTQPATSLTPEQIKEGVRKGGLAWFRQHAGTL